MILRTSPRYYLSFNALISILTTPLDVVVQGHRANIVQGLGCYPTFYNTALAYPLLFMWPVLLSCIAIVYGMLSLRAWLRRRNSVEQFNISNASGLNADRYFRLMCFSAVEVTISFPISLWVMVSNLINIPLSPWISWEDTHYMFNRFNQLPASFIESDTATYNQLLVVTWAHPGICLLFFIFFGFGREQINQYKRWVYAALKPFGVKPPQPKPYSNDRRTWWQKLLRQPASTQYGTGLNSSRGPADSLPAFRHGSAQVGSYGEKPIPSARSNAQPTLDTMITFELDQYDEKLDTDSDIVDSKHLHVGYNANKSLPSSPTVVGESDGDDKYSRRTTKMSTSTASSVPESSQGVSGGTRSEAELRAIEARVQRLP